MEREFGPWRRLHTFPMPPKLLPATPWWETTRSSAADVNTGCQPLPWRGNGRQRRHSRKHTWALRVVWRKEVCVAAGAGALLHRSIE